MASQQRRQETPFMSFDPFGQSTPADPGPPPATPTDEQYHQARDRVQWAAMFLIASSTLNLLLALFQLGNFIQNAMKPANVLHREMEEQFTKLSQNPGPMAKIFRQTLDQLQETTPEQLRRQTLIQLGVLVFLLLLVALLGVLGGVRMYQLQSYSLAMLGSLASAVPCLSPMTCCCGIGVMIGGWCVLVLLNPEVREVFHS
jgi:hypothetical protein